MAGPGGQEVGRISVRVVPNTEHFRRELKAQLEAIEDSLKVEIDVDPDMDGFRAKVRAATSNMPDAKVKVDADLAKAVAAINALGATKKKVKVEVDVDRSPLDRLANGIGDILDKTKTSGGGGGGRFLAPFIDNLALVAGIAAIAAPAIALISGALAALPAVLAAVAAPILAVTLGMEGISKAAGSLAEPFTALKTSVSGVFESRLTPVFDKLAAIMPRLEGPMGAVANGISDVADSFVSMIVSGDGMTRIEGTIGNIAKAISASAPGVTKLTDGLLGLAEGVSAKFPAVAGWIDKVGTSFDNWVNEKLTDGSLDRAMGNFGETVKGVLDIFGDIASQGFEWLQDPNFGKSMTDFVNNTKTLVGDIMPGLSGIFTQISGALNGIVPVLDSINDWKPPDWMGLGGGSDKGKGGWLTPPDKGWNEDVTKFRENVERADKTVEGFGGFPDMKLPEDPLVDSGFLDGIERRITDGAWWSGMFKQGMGSAEGPGQTMSDLLDINNFLASPGTKIIDWFKNTIGIGLPQAAAETGQQTGVQLGQKLQEGMQPAVQPQTLIPDIAPQVQAALTPLQTIPAQVQQAFSGIGATVTGSMAQVVGAVAGAGGQIVSAFTGSLSQIPGVAAQTFAAVTAAAAGGMANVVSTIAAGAAQAVSTVQAMGQQIVAALQSAASGAQAAGAAVGQGMAAGIAASKGAAVAAAQDLAAAVSAAAKVELGVKSPSKVFTEIGANTAQGLADGIEGGTEGVIQRATELADKLSQAVNDGLAGVDGTALNTAIKQQLDELELQRKQLKVEKNAIPKEDKEGRAAIQGQMDQIQALKDQLNLQKDQLGFSNKYADSTDSVAQANNIITDQIASMIDMAKGFFNATSGQFMNDLGMSGEGAIPSIANQMLDWGAGALSKQLSAPFSNGGVNINVNSVDEALAARTNIVNKDALRYRQR